MDEAQEPKISGVVGIIGTTVAVVLDLIGLIPGADDVEAVPVVAIIVLNKVSGMGDTVLLVQGGVTILKLIPVVQEFPLWTLAWLATWYMENHPLELTEKIEEAAKVAATIEGEGGGAGTAAAEAGEAAEAGGVATEAGGAAEAGEAEVTGVETTPEIESVEEGGEEVGGEGEEGEGEGEEEEEKKKKEEELEEEMETKEEKPENLEEELFENVQKGGGEEETEEEGEETETAEGPQPTEGVSAEDAQKLQRAKEIKEGLQHPSRGGDVTKENQ